MRTTKPNLVCDEYVFEDCDERNPAQFKSGAVSHVLNNIVYNISENEIFWIEDDKVLHMSRDFAKLHYPKLYRTFMELKYA